MYKQCRTEQSAQRQRELEKGLLAAMLRQDYDEISVSDLCDQLGVPRKSFYRYFSGKDGALYALIDHALMDYDDYVNTHQLEEKRTPQQFMEQVFSYWKQCKPLLDALQRSNLSGVLVQRAIDQSKNEVDFPWFLTSDERNIHEYVTMFTVCGIMSMVVQWHHEGYAQSVDRMAQIALRLVSRPLFPDVEQYV